MFIIVYLFLYYFLFPYVGNINGRHYQGPVYSFLLHSIQSKSDTRICFISTGFVRRKHQPRCSDAQVQRNAISCRKRDYSTFYSIFLIEGYDIDFKAYYNILSHIIHIYIYIHIYLYYNKFHSLQNKLYLGEWRHFRFYDTICSYKPCVNTFL